MAVGLLLTALVVILLGSLAWGPGAREAHQVPIGLVAPGAAAQIMANPEGGFGANTSTHPYPSRARAEAALQRGELVALLVVDLTGTRDDLLVDRARNAALTDSVVATLTQRSHSFGRTLRLTSVHTSAEGASDRRDWAVV